MSSDVITIDFSGVLDEKQLAEIEEKTNRNIWEDNPVEIFIRIRGACGSALQK